MAYDEALAERVRELITLREDVTERKMFGGIAWMLAGNMACGVLGDELIVRLDPEDAERALAEPHTRPFDFTGRPARNMAMVAPAGTAADAELAAWVDAGADFAASLPPK
jgi:TfoX/Sxy family transcriptional regulator of competence genes